MSNYEDDLRIDKYNLDYEWERQAQLYMKWAEAHAQAVLERDRAKELLDLARAELDSQIRESPEKFGFDKKPTETAIANTILQQDRYREVYKNFVETTKNMNILAGAKEAMAHKKKALEGITQLMVSGYYAEPNIPKEAKEKSMERTKASLKQGLKRSKRLNR